ncbi:uncharacterized protein LOC134189515 [Corticium candelabrum]|uniref:uncharacterized protein LOC134189515 n=1 Tax=Corticium candelabrum TaxID=121492 RepID=UPI002E2616A3|nr:uncharacterized protein LOC134189515 [Corticium candelabrum]
MHDEGGTQSSAKVFANIFISFVGAGVLGLPFAFKEAGVMEGSLIMTFIAIISTKSLLLLIDCKYKLMSKSEVENGHGVNSGHESPIPFDRDLEYGDVGFHALGSVGQFLVEIPVLVSQAGFSCAYLIFISENVSNVLPALSKNTWLLIMMIPLFFLCTLKHLKSLGTFSIFADFANVFAYGIVYWFDFEHIHLVKLHPNTWSMNGFTFFVCMSIYCYEGAGMILSLEQSASQNSNHDFRYLFKCVMFVVTVIYISFGVCGYLSFGAETNSIITLNLPPGVFPLLVKSCLCFSLFFTYPVMMFPVTRMLDIKLGIDSNSNSSGNSPIALRAAVVVFTCIVVLAIPSFSDLMALVGATCCTMLLLTLPGLFHYILFKGQLSKLESMLDIFLIVSGVIGAILGTADAVHRIYT